MEQEKYNYPMGLLDDPAHQCDYNGRKIEVWILKAPRAEVEKPLSVAEEKLRKSPHFKYGNVHLCKMIEFNIKIHAPVFSFRPFGIYVMAGPYRYMVRWRYMRKPCIRFEFWKI